MELLGSHFYEIEDSVDQNSVPGNETVISWYENEPIVGRQALEYFDRLKYIMSQIWSVKV